MPTYGPALVPTLTGPPAAPIAPAGFEIVVAERPRIDAYRSLRKRVFVDEQGIFAGDDHDRADDDPRTVVLVALTGGVVVGGVRLAPADHPGTDDQDIGWWTGSRLAVDPTVRGSAGIGSALVRAACSKAEGLGALRFEATVQEQNERMFARLGWVPWGRTSIGGVPHVRMRWPIERIRRLAERSKAFLSELLEPYSGWADDSPSSLGGSGWVGDDGAPVPGTDVVAACDAILPVLIERDPEWAGWCAVLVNVNDLSAMGARPAGLMNAIGARDASFARRIMGGLRAGSQAWGAPILGGHTQLGVASALSVTALGRAASPVPGGGGRFGHALGLTVDLAGGWRRGFEGTQWDSTSTRSSAELRALGDLVPAARPAAAKDVSMAGIVGTVGMLAEASGCGAVLTVDRIPSPRGATAGDWLTCFPGYGMVTADAPGASRMDRGVDPGTVVHREVGRLTLSRGVCLEWPDGERTPAIPGPVTGLGRA